MNRIEYLESEISKHDELYWAKDEPIISDEAYDLLVEELRALAPGSPVLHKVHGQSTDHNKVTHLRKMESLGKVYTREELRKWIYKVARSLEEKFFCAPKYDGISIEDQGGVLLSTRGDDGVEGEDISHLYPLNTPVKYEVYTQMPYNSGSSIQKFIGPQPPCPLCNDTGEYEEDDGPHGCQACNSRCLPFVDRMGKRVFADWGDVIAKYPDGSLSLIARDDVDKTSAPVLYGELVMRKSVFEANQGILVSSSGTPYKNPRAAASGIARNRNLPIDIQRLVEFIPFDWEQDVFLLTEFDEIDWDATLADYKGYDVPTDGAVIGLVDRSYGLSLGGTEHHPNHSIALKYKNPAATTKLINVKWQPGKGRISPVGILEPVELSGVTISKVSLHNMDFINKDLGCLKIGDIVEIQRMGDVIPGVARIVKATEESEAKEIICSECPECGSAVVLDGKHYRCSTGSDCVGGKAKLLRDALVRLDIEGIGPGTIQKLIEEGVDDILKVLHTPHEFWKSLAGFGDKSAAKAYQEIRNRVTRPCEDYKVLAALNIPGIGISMAKKVMDDMSFAEFQEAEVATIARLDGFDTTRAEEVVNGRKKNIGLLLGLLGILTIKETKGVGKRTKVVFTGKSEIPRADWFAMARAAGFEPMPRVTKAVDLVVCASTDSTSTKAKTARRYGIRVVTYDQFKEEINNGNSEA